jgi:bromodomain-containing factor 1
MMEEGSQNQTLIEYQLKFCSSVLTKVKRNSNAAPFLEPVDPIKLNIPDYPLKIKRPMDLSTIRRKLDGKIYRTPDEFDADMKLMFENCYTYNPEGSPVNVIGKALEMYYNKEMAAMPQEITKKKKIDIALTDRSKQPKRTIKPVETMKIEDQEFCSEVLTDLLKPKHKAYNWPFLEPVDEALVPGYHAIIRNPMDLQTMRSKLDQRRYQSVDEFVGDLRLIVDNCFKFNAPGSEVYICGQELEHAVDAHMQKFMPVDIKGKIAELKKKIIAHTKEIKVLEAKLAEQSGEKAPATRTYSISERISLGNAILGMNKAQTEHIARIIQKHSAGEFVENDEIEVDLRLIPDVVAEEIDMYVKKVSAGIDDAQNEGSAY